MDTIIEKPLRIKRAMEAQRRDLRRAGVGRKFDSAGLAVMSIKKLGLLDGACASKSVKNGALIR
jgi:hypothetical protein